MSARVRSVTLVVFLVASTWLGAQEAPKQEFWVQKDQEWRSVCAAQ